MFDATHVSVLHYLVAHMEANLPGALELEAEEAALREAAKKGSLDASGCRGKHTHTHTHTHELCMISVYAQDRSQCWAPLGCWGCGAGCSRHADA